MGSDPDGLLGVIYAEELHWGCAGIALAISASSLAAAGIAASGTPEQIGQWVPECFGEGDEIKLGAYAVTEAGAGSDVKSLRTTAKLDGDEWVLNGTKVFISNGGIADVNVVVATVDPELGHRGQASFIVPKDTPGPVAGQEGGQDRHPRLADRRGRARGRAASRWTTCWAARRSSTRSSSAPARARRGGPSNALATFEITRPMVGASALGIAQAAYEWTLEYLEDKSDENGPLLEQQRVQQVLADVATEIEAARLLVWRAAWMGRNGMPMTGGQGSMSKLKAGDVTMWATTTLMDLVGDYAQTTDCPLEKWFRDAKIYQLFEGTAQVQRLVISRMQRQDYQRAQRGRRRGAGAGPGHRHRRRRDRTTRSRRRRSPVRPRRPPFTIAGVGFSFDPAVIALLLGATALYVRAVRVLGGRGYEVPSLAAGRLARRACALTADRAAVAARRARRGAAGRPHGPAPADRRPGRPAAADRHPLAGLRVPPAAAGAGAARPPAAACGGCFRWLRQPLVAIPVWVLILYGWHFGVRVRGRAATTTSCTPSSTRSFVLGAVLVWWSVIEPKRRRAARRPVEGALPDRRAAGGHVPRHGLHPHAHARLRRPLRRRRAPEHGISALTDQQVAGGMMLALDLLVMLFALGRSSSTARRRSHDRAERAAAVAG